MIDAVVEEHRTWIDRTTRSFRQQAKGTVANAKLALPARVHLAAARERYQVLYRHCRGIRPRLTSLEGRRIELRCDLTEPMRPLATLRRWVRRSAADVLSARIERLSERHGLPYSSCSVRNQKTVWGTCSADGVIYLNYKLVFLKPKMVDYVITHELVHTRHMDHSPRFWGLLDSLIPGARGLDDALRSAWREIPPWVERG